MSARRLPDTDETIYAVKQWKETLDPTARWWQHWFHRFVYKPFNEFSLRVMKIPPVTSFTVEGDRVSFSVVEDGGFFGSEHEADLACLTEHDSYQGLPYGRVFPRRSAQCVGPTIFPRAKRPLKRAVPIFGMIIKSRKEDDRERRTLAQQLNHLNQLLDR
jgi:hypothetical protein